MDILFLSPLSFGCSVVDLVKAHVVLTAALERG